MSFAVIMLAVSKGPFADACEWVRVCVCECVHVCECTKVYVLQDCEY